MNLFKFGRREQEPDEETSIEGERELSSVNKGITLQNKITNLAVMGGACALAAFLLYRYYSNMYVDYQQSKAPTKDTTRTMTTSSLPALVMPDPGPAKVSAIPGGEKLPPLHPPAGSVPAAVNSPGQPPVKTLSQLVHERRLKSDVRFNLDGHAPGAAALSGTPADYPEPVAGAGAPTFERGTGAGHGAEARSAAAKLVQPANFKASRAYMLPDPMLMMTRGMVIPCTVLPATDTTLAGTVTCITGEDATGADNKVSLMERGTICTGKQGGGVVHGQRRIGFIWDRCRTPQHVLVPLEANATDSLGRPGVPGEVDNHFWDRFGGAIALSLITDIGPYLAATKQGGNNNTTVAFPTITGPQQVVSEVLKNSVDIPPTIHGPQGARVLIYLAGDIDFRDVYQLERMK